MLQQLLYRVLCGFCGLLWLSRLFVGALYITSIVLNGQDNILTGLYSFQQTLSIIFLSFYFSLSKVHEYPIEYNQDVVYWTEITRQLTQTFNI